MKKIKTLFLVFLSVVLFAASSRAGKLDLDFTEKNRKNALVRATLVPGWGQFFKEEPYKGATFFTATLGTLAWSLHLDNESRKSLSAYKAKGVAGDSLYSDYESQKKQADLLLLVSLSLWIYNMADAYFHDASGASSESSTALKAGPRGTGLAFRFGGGEQ